MSPTYQTTAPVLIAILIGYVVLCFILGVGKIYFKPWTNIGEDENKPSE